MDKYVAFIDILGFKAILKSKSHQEAVRFIGDFSTLLYQEWHNLHCDTNPYINGFIVSDSVIIHTTDASKEALAILLELIMNIFKRAFKKDGILLRGAIAKGEFDNLKAESFDNLQKGLIVGNAYVEAYTLESAAKTSAILISDQVKLDISEYFDNNQYEAIKINGKAEQYALRWGDIDFLLDADNCQKFVELAKEAKWLPHYFNVLYLFMYKANHKKKQQQVFENIFAILSKNDNTTTWREINIFIENSFAEDVEHSFKVMFMTFLREKIYT